MDIINYLKSINEYIDGREIIIHSDLNSILTSFPSLIKKNRINTLDNICFLLNNYLSSKSIFIPSFNYGFLKNGIYDVENDIGEIVLFNINIKIFVSLAA